MLSILERGLGVSFNLISPRACYRERLFCLRHAVSSSNSKLGLERLKLWLQSKKLGGAGRARARQASLRIASQILGSIGFQLDTDQ